MKRMMAVLILAFVAPVGAAEKLNLGSTCSSLTLDLAETLGQVPSGASEVEKAQIRLLSARVVRLAALGVFLGCGTVEVPYQKAAYRVPAAAKGQVEDIMQRLVAHVKADKPLSPPTPRTCRWLYVAYTTSIGAAKSNIAALHAKMQCPATTETMPDFADPPNWP